MCLLVLWGFFVLYSCLVCLVVGLFGVCFGFVCVACVFGLFLMLYCYVCGV